MILKAWDIELKWVFAFTIQPLDDVSYEETPLYQNVLLQTCAVLD